ncbi:hypothetical protein HRbin39_00917 [bacterium HR39]|nr:hypothetical protein HRbin39_00917 [bacterium HR39]
MEPQRRRAPEEVVRDLMERHFVVQAPAHVNLRSFETTALVNLGTESEPLYKARFDAVLELRGETYEEIGRIGPVIWLRTVAKPGETVRVYGNASAARRGDGPWQVEFALEFNPLPRLGQPRQMFEGETVVRGTDEERRLLGRLAELARERLALELPGYWMVEGLELLDTAIREDRIEARFSASLVLRDHTFAERAREDDVFVVAPVAEAGSRSALSGRASFLFRNGRWEVELAPENNPLTALGRPLAFFEGRVVIEGSEEEKAWREARHRRELEEMKRRQELEEQKRQAELAEAEHRRRLEEQKRAEAEARRRAELAELARQLRGRLALGLQGHWRVGEVTLSEPLEREGGVLEFAFTAPLELAEDTFVEKAREEEAVLVERVGTTGEVRTLRGKALARRADGGWRFEVEVGNNPVATLGHPVDFFGGKVLVEGSDEEKAWREARHRRQLEEMKRQQELEEQKRQSELAEARHRTLLEQERQKLELAKLQFEERLEQERLAREAARRQREMEKRQRELAALRTALQSPDPALRAMALDAALKSGDTGLRQLALHEWLKRTTRVALEIEAADKRGQETIADGINTFALDFANFDETSGSFTGQIVAPVQNQPADMQFSGRITGEAISLASPTCQATLRLGEDPVLRGELRCGGLVRYSNSSYAGIFRVSVPLR